MTGVQTCALPISLGNHLGQTLGLGLEILAGDFEIGSDLIARLLDDLVRLMPGFRHALVALSPSGALRRVTDIVGFTARLLQAALDLIETLRLNGARLIELATGVVGATLALVDDAAQRLEEKLVQNHRQEDDRGTDRQQGRQVWKILHCESGGRRRAEGVCDPSSVVEMTLGKERERRSSEF